MAALRGSLDCPHCAKQVSRLELCSTMRGLTLCNHCGAVVRVSGLLMPEILLYLGLALSSGFLMLKPSFIHDGLAIGAMSLLMAIGVLAMPIYLKVSPVKTEAN